MAYKNIELRRKNGLKQYYKHEADGSGRKHRLKNRYGITIEQWQDMWNKQGGKCALCLNPPAKYLCVDHNHDTGIVRGLLCIRCNYVVGVIDECGAEYLKRAEEYINN